ncbi:uncharacterized protein VTP21DRAFT_10789 [Calcarisporiella thermophila]|uniref:uncharacterized protein n=1 Tax=Calcarisporiella thermophila TaxID=911321 RepID=UPI003743484E
MTIERQEAYYIGVDVGTGSVRAAVVDSAGNIVGLASSPTTTFHPRADYYEQSTAEIWDKLCTTVREAIAQTPGVTSEQIKGIGFDATCSLAVVDAEGNGVSVDPESEFNDHNRNIILWADHRAEDQARRITATGHPVLQYVGGKISLEMEVPKILWLKENMPAEKWENISHFFDLPDFLTFRATGSLARSQCSLVCKCSYVPREVEWSTGWNDDFFEQIGLGELAGEGFQKLGGRHGKIHYAGEAIGGLSKEAAEQMGLLPGLPVGSAVIDAYAGAIATMGADVPQQDPSPSPNGELLETPPQNRLAIICGTSSCHIALSREPIFVDGVWGPYLSVMIPGMWMAEPGQSSVGQLIDYIVFNHPSTHVAKEKAADRGVSIYQFLNDYLHELIKVRKLKHMEELTRHYHVYPDFHGNRSPVADPNLRGAIVGLSLDNSLDNLALQYYATLQAVACQTRHIIEALNSAGHTIDTLFLSGGLCKNPVFVALHANITRCRTVLPKYVEGAVVLGAAILGARAAESSTRSQSTPPGSAETHMTRSEKQSLGQDDGAMEIWNVMKRMGTAGGVILPTEDKEKIRLNEGKYRVFKAMLEDQYKYRKIMDSEEF